MTYNVFGGTLSITQSINRRMHINFIIITDRHLECSCPRIGVHITAPYILTFNYH